MTEAIVYPHRRYRRRILGWGLVVLVLAFVVPAFFALAWVERDLENRVPDALADAGIEQVTAEFSGQDGTLRCAAPLDDPDRAVTVAGDVYGVRRVELDPACTGPDEADGAEPSEETSATTSEAVADSTEPLDATSAPPSSTTQPPPSTLPGPVETISQIVAEDPQFSQLASLLASAGADDLLDRDGPFTLLAPTDAAFDAAFEAVGADAFQALTSDPDRLRAVLLHHVTNGVIASSDFEPGSLEMLDGTTVDVEIAADGAEDGAEAGAIVFVSGDTTAMAADPAQVDIETSNGIVHAIDQVLLPADLVVEVPEVDPVTSANLADGRVTLSGLVQTEAQRGALVATAQAAVAEENVVDELVVDPDVTVVDADLERLGALVAAMPENLVSGTATLTGDGLALVGVHTGEAQNAAISAVADQVGATVDLEARPGADDESAQALQDELNDFVRANPILFEPNSVELTADAGAVVEQVAARAQRFDGALITIIGHTDSDGDGAFNQTLSEGRANTVLVELVAAGIPAASLSAEGRGETVPVLDADGNEDKVASRRVEFVVRAQP